MTLQELIDKSEFELVCGGNNGDTVISRVFCCDLLSFAMSRNPQNSVWVTVMGNVNTIAVAVLTEGACIVLAEGAALDEAAKEKAISQGVTVLRTELPIFEAGLRVKTLLDEAE